MPFDVKDFYPFIKGTFLQEALVCYRKCNHNNERHQSDISRAKVSFAKWYRDTSEEIERWLWCYNGKVWWGGSVWDGGLHVFKNGSVSASEKKKTTHYQICWSKMQSESCKLVCRFIVYDGSYKPFPKPNNLNDIFRKSIQTTHHLWSNISQNPLKNGYQHHQHQKRHFRKHHHMMHSL